MQKIKFMAILTIATVLIGILSGCNSLVFSSVNGGGFVDNKGIEVGNGGSTVNNNGNHTGTVTLKQFLDSGPKVGFTIQGTPNKSEYPYIYLFENGKVYMVCTWQSGEYCANHEKGQGKGALTWGDISKMTDEELLSFAQEHKQLKFKYPVGFEYDFYSNGTSRYVTGDYTLRIYTDSTGNNFEYERIEVDQEYFHSNPFVYNEEWRKYDFVDLPGVGKLNTYTEKSVIYNSVFSGLTGIGGALYFRTGENLTIVVDNLGDEGVETD